MMLLAKILDLKRLYLAIKPLTNYLHRCQKNSVAMNFIWRLGMDTSLSLFFVGGL
jgi:hypothetical protein